VKWHNVIGDPGLGGEEFGQGGNVAVSNGDGHGDAGVGESVEDVGVGVKYLNAVDGGLGFEKGGDFGRWWEVVGDSVVVDADGVCRIKLVLIFYLFIYFFGFFVLIFFYKKNNMVPKNSSITSRDTLKPQIPCHV
jgi:hypothetical protein